MAESNAKVASVLNDLIETCRDGENGFRDAAEAVKDAELRTLFSRYSTQRMQFAAALQNVVSQLGAKAETSGTAAAAVHRGWINVKSAVTGHDDGAIISECERGEDAAKSAYQKALKQDLPMDIRSLVQQQYSAVLESHDTVRRLEVKTH